MILEVNEIEDMESLIISLSEKLEKDNWNQEEISLELSNLHFSDLSILIGGLPLNKSMLIVTILGENFPASALTETTADIRNAILRTIGIRQFSVLVSHLYIDDAIMILEDLEDLEVKSIINLLPKKKQDLLQHVLESYDDDTAGRMMQWQYVALHKNWTVEEALTFTRENRKNLPMLFYDYYIIDKDNKPVGYIPVSTLVRSHPKLKLRRIMNPSYVPIPAHMDQEDVANLFSARDFVSAPVVDDQGCIIGSITIDDVVDVIKEEHQEDLMHMGGLSDSDFYKSATQTVSKRFLWLVVNLLATFLSARIISIFSHTVEQIVILASLMPIVNSIVGSSGTQALTVLIRSIATNELTHANSKSAFIKELNVGIINGIIFGILAFLGTYVLYHSLGVAIILGLAMLVNLFIAGLLGYLVPIILNAMKIDPAVASGVILTTLTDMCGFYIFLSLATIFLL